MVMFLNASRMVMDVYFCVTLVTNFCFEICGCHRGGNLIYDELQRIIYYCLIFVPRQSMDGVSGSATFSSPTALAFGATQYQLYCLDTVNNRVRFLQLATSGMVFIRIGLT